jgi:rod shape-determining protein MreD
MRPLRIFLLIVSLVVLQTALFPSLRVWDTGPDLLLLATIAVAYDRGPEAGASFGFVGGIAIDCFLSSPFGVSALAFSLVGYAVGVFQSGLIRASRWLTPVLGGFGGLLGGALWVAIAALAGQDELAQVETLRTILLAAAYDALLAPLVFPFARWACGHHDVARR